MSANLILLKIKVKVHKMFEVELIFDFWLTFLLQIFIKKILCLKNISKVVRPVLATLSVSGLINAWNIPKIFSLALWKQKTISRGMFRNDQVNPFITGHIHTSLTT